MSEPVTTMTSSSIAVSKTASQAEAENIFRNIAEIDENILTQEAFVKWFVGYQNKQAAPATAASTNKRPASELTAEAPVAAFTSAKKAKSNTGLAVPAGALQQVPAAQTKTLVKGFVTDLKKSIKTKKFYNYGSTEECTAECVMSPEVFNSIFGLVGTVPPETKVSSVVTTKQLSVTDLACVFGEQLVGLTAQTYSRPRSFQKQFKTGSADLVVSSASLYYSKNTMACKVKFMVSSESNGSSEVYFGWM